VPVLVVNGFEGVEVGHRHSHTQAAMMVFDGSLDTADEIAYRCDRH
jgi:hypothetical protein